MFELFSLDSVTGGGTKKIAERYYQVEAVQAICAGLAEDGRGQLRSACGTGKTVMCQRSAELLCGDGGLVVILCPSIDLVAQTLREWKDTTDGYVAMAVCSDETVEDAVVTVDDVPATVTTDVEDVAAWLRTPIQARLRLIVGTHVSAHVVGDALLGAGKTVDLLIIDEAHRTAGVVDKHTALVHDDRRLPALRRLYATATPKIVGEKTRGQKASAITRVVGMDDPSVFGPVLYNYPFSRAIQDGYLDDYRLVVMGVTRSEIADYLATVPRTATGAGLPTTLHTAMVQTVLAKAARQYGFRRALTFCRRLNEANDFARTMNVTLSGLPEDMKPAGFLTTGYVHGGMTASERQKRLQQLREPPYGGWTVVTNVRCLAEGVDVPAIDAVAFTHPKQSVAEIVQAIGRALRRDPNGSGVATILVPILLPDTPESADAADEIDVSDYRLLWQVLKALRAHDDKLGATIDQTTLHTHSPYQYEEQPLEHVIINLPAGYGNGSFLHQLTAKIITATGGSWWNNFELLKHYYKENGHVAVPRDYAVYDEARRVTVKLGVWTDNVRVSHRKGQLAQDRIDALEDLGFDFHADAVDWAEGLRAAAAFFEEHGHLEPVKTLRVNGIHLRSWLDKQRSRAANGELVKERHAALQELRMRWRDRPKTFDEYVAALTAYRAEHGHIDIAPELGTDEGHLGNWLINMRIQRKMDKLSDAEINALDALGINWSRREPTDSTSPSSPASPATARPNAPSSSSKGHTVTPAAKAAERPTKASTRPSIQRAGTARSLRSKTQPVGHVRTTSPSEPTTQVNPEPVAAPPQTSSQRPRIVKPPIPVFQEPQH